MSTKRPFAARFLMWSALAAPLVTLLLGACAKASAFKCDLNRDCSVGMYCGTDGTCQRQCVDATRDCPMGYVCSANGMCEFHGGSGGAPPTSTTGPGSTTNAATGTSTTTNTTTTNTTTNAATVTTGVTTTSTTSSGMGSKLLLDLCGADSECTSGLCRAMVKGGTQRCTTSCTSDANCPAGMRCDDGGGGALVCLASDVGRTCTAPTTCNFGCLTGPGVCTAKCTSGSDCPNGWGCMAVGSPPQSVCVRAEAVCDASNTSQCIVSMACDTASTQLLVTGCTLACNSAADCPRRAAGLAPWTCNGLCQRPPDVYGPLQGGSTPTQYACNAAQQVVNLCNDGQHIDFTQFTTPNPPAVNCASTTTTSGVAGDSCLESCRYQGGCINGFACSALAAIAGSRVGLCMPAGFGEVGAPCSKEGDCAFGLCANNVCSRDCTADGVCPSGSTCVATGGPAVEGAAFRRCQ